MSKSYLIAGESYEAPFVEIVAAQAENVLATSPKFGGNDEAGSIMDESDESTWDF